MDGNSASSCAAAEELTLGGKSNILGFTLVVHHAEYTR